MIDTKGLPQRGQELSSRSIIPNPLPVHDGFEVQRGEKQLREPEGVVERDGLKRRHDGKAPVVRTDDAVDVGEQLVLKPTYVLGPRHSQQL